jgi:hypothetical protein
MRSEKRRDDLPVGAAALSHLLGSEGPSQVGSRDLVVK